MDVVRVAYAARTQEYTDLFGSIGSTDPADRELVTRWASGIGGRILDLGCGPGQWTDHLRLSGSDVYGLDPVPEFVAGARRRFPESVYRIGTAQHIAETDGALAGIVAWYSLIHLPPPEIDDVLAELGRCLAPGGGLLLGFFDGPAGEPFDHAVVTAYWWSVDELHRRLDAAGFTVTGTATRTDPGRRPHGAVVAVRGRPADPVATDPLTPL